MEKILSTHIVEESGYIMKFTQKLHPRYSFGHYNWAVEDSDGNILMTGYSAGLPVEQLNSEDVNKMFQRALMELRE